MIPEIAPYNNYTGNNSAKKFDFDFYIENNSQLKVQYTDNAGISSILQEGTDYSIAEIGNKNGSYIIFPLDNSSHGLLQSDEVISLQLSLPISQESEYGKSSELDMVSLEYSFDYLTRICQIINRQLERAVKVQEGSNIDTDILVQNINQIVDNIDKVQTVSAYIHNVVTTALNIKDVNTTASHIGNVDTVSGHITKVDIVANHIANIDTTATHIGNVDTVSTNITKVNICANNINEIIDAPNQANIAIEKANVATIQADIATQKADAAIIALSDAEALKNALELFSSIDCGTLSDTHNIIYDAGSLSDAATNYINCGTAADNYISDNDIENVLNIPLLQKQADATDALLENSIKRISNNEISIEELQNDLSDFNSEYDKNILRIDDNISKAVNRITNNEINIDNLESNLSDTNKNLDAAKLRITQNENDIEELQKISGVFSYVDSGYLSDVQAKIYDAGTLSSKATNYIDCSTLERFFISLEDLKNVCTIPNLLNAVSELTGKLQDALARISELENGIDCGVLRYVR